MNQRPQERRAAAEAAPPPDSAPAAPPADGSAPSPAAEPPSVTDAAAAEGVELEYVPPPPPEAPARPEDDPEGASFASIFAAFQLRGGDGSGGGGSASEAAGAAAGASAAAAGSTPAEAAAAAAAAAAATAAAEAEAAAAAAAEAAAEAAVSRRKARLARRPGVAELKAACAKPEVVEVWDATAADPMLLVHLKSVRNSVPVPRHWSQKRKFLQGKRGVDKPPWELPPFLAATGIGKLRDAYAAKEEEKSAKGKAHARMAPKLGRIDIDYQLLHDAFFKHQTKPRLSREGDLYFEGKEYEVELANKRPGHISAALQTALGMGQGMPPPWLVNQQRYGPPPAYPHLRIPGLNAPIPVGASFGYHAGGWGKPLVDEAGAPLYGDVFGTGAAAAAQPTVLDVPVDKSRVWGALDPPLDVSDSEGEGGDGGGDGDEEGGDGDGEAAAGEGGDAGTAGGLSAADVALGLASTQSSLPSGVATPADLDLRKGGTAGLAIADAVHRPLYSVLEQKAAHVGAGSIMGASHTYALPPSSALGPSSASASAAAAGGAAVAGSRAARRAAAAHGVSVAAAPPGAGVAVALAPEELEQGIDDAALAARYEAAARAGAGGGGERAEDFSDLVAQQAQKAKRKADGKGKDDKGKKFKF